MLDDFHSLQLASGSRLRVRKSNPDKGHKLEMMALIEAVKLRRPAPIAFEQIALVSKTTFAILEALSTGKPATI